MAAVVLVLPKAGYRNDDFVAAARKLGAQVLVASDDCHQLAEIFGSESIALKEREARAAGLELAAALQQRVRARPASDDAPRAGEVAAILGVDDRTALIAAWAAEKLGLPHNAPEAVAAARDKAESRARLAAAGLPVPRFQLIERDHKTDPVGFPCVAKPLSLSGSRGVIRANDARELREAVARIQALLRSPDVAARNERLGVLVEEFVPGAEIAVEGLLVRRALRVLAVFDKPDPLDGPYFEETLYVTPSRHAPELIARAERIVEQGCRALGLVEGPVHAELRLSPGGPVILEIAARSIGGLCGRALRFGLGVTLEELVLRHALGLPIGDRREPEAAGVAMLPVPGKGVLEEVRGVEEAKEVPLIEEVTITARLREPVTPLPEGASYFGFAFARGPTPDAVEEALRAAQSKIEARVTPRLPLV